MACYQHMLPGLLVDIPLSVVTLPLVFSEKMDFAETLSFQQIVKHLFTEGTVPVPPKPPLRFASVSYYLSGVIAPGGCHIGGGGSIPCRSPKKER